MTRNRVRGRCQSLLKAIRHGASLLPSSRFGRPNKLALATLIAIWPVTLKANTVYLSQNGGTFANGSACNGQSTQTYSYFNNVANWTSGTPTGSQIGPGTTVYLCGTITVAANNTILIAQGSGTNGSPITIKFDTNAILQAPYFQGDPVNGCGPDCGAIMVSGQNYITVDGGGTGIIQSTANGSSLAFQSPNMGVYLNGDHLMVKNLTVQNIYVNSSAESSSQPGFDTADLRVIGTNIEICNDVLNNAHVGIWSSTSQASYVSDAGSACTDTQAAAGINYYNNTLSDHGWQMNIGGSGYLNIYNNDIGNWANWFYPTGTPYHLDGLLVAGGDGMVRPYIYDNYIHGDFVNGSPTGFIFCTYGASYGSACTIYNNLLIGTGGTATGGQGIYFHSADGNAMGPHVIYNNTLYGFGTGEIYTDGDSTQVYTVENNIFISDGNYYMTINSTPTSNFTSNHNDFYGGRNPGGGTGGFPGGVNLATWQSEGEDAASVESNPNLSASWFIQNSSSPAYQLGTNLTSVGITSLDTGAPGSFGTSYACGSGCAARLSLGAWDAGAYPDPPATTGQPSPPTGLTASVN